MGSGQQCELAREAVFVARGLTKTYQMGSVVVQALRGIDLELYSGEFLVLLGPSGSGKSTLLNILGGLDVPTAGDVWFRDHHLTDSDDLLLTTYRRDHVGFVFQFYNLIPSLTALENVALVADLADEPLDPAEALQLVGLADRMNHFPAQLSGGEQQRVNVILDLTDSQAHANLLGDAFRVDARIEVDRVDPATLAPSAAIFRSGDQSAVFVVQHGRARIRTIQTGRRSDSLTEVLAGLQPDESVVIYPSDKVADGVLVREER